MVEKQLDLPEQPAQRQPLLGIFTSSKLVVFVLWMALIGGYAFYAWQSDRTFLESLSQLREFLHSAYGPLLYLLLFVLRSFLFFSAGLLSIAGGIIFGSGEDGSFVLALVYVWLGTVLSASVSFGLARFFGSEFMPQSASQGEGTRRWSVYTDLLRRNGFMAVLIMRLLLLPFDPINVLAGCMRVDWRAFTLATLLGIFPTAFVFVSFGAAIDMQRLAAGEMPQFDFRMLLLAVGILAGSLVLSRIYQRSLALRPLSSQHPTQDSSKTVR